MGERKLQLIIRHLLKQRLNNELVAQDLTTTYYQHNDLVDGQEYITKVVAGSSSAEYTWTKVACDNFKGVTDLSADVF